MTMPWRARKFCTICLDLYNLRHFLNVNEFYYYATHMYLYTRTAAYFVRLEMDEPSLLSLSSELVNPCFVGSWAWSSYTGELFFLSRNPIFQGKEMRWTINNAFWFIGYPPTGSFVKGKWKKCMYVCMKVYYSIPIRWSITKTSARYVCFDITDDIRLLWYLMIFIASNYGLKVCLQTANVCRRVICKYR